MEKVLTPDQENAEKLIKEWFFNTDNLVFVLAGYAGTGKTFLIDRIVRESLHLKAGTEAVFVTPTGKAATVLIKNGTVAGTVHSLIYTRNEDDLDVDENGEIVERETLSFTKKEKIDEKIRLIIVDEASMIGEDVLRDLLSFGVKCLFSGDNAQLPPVNGTCGLFDPKTGKFVGKHDFNQIFWYDQHFIGTRSSGTKSYLLDGKGGETLLPANVKEYSSWAKTEVAAAGEHGLTESFSYPRLDITRENFTMLAMNLYNKIYPNKEIPALETKFTDCRNDPNVNNAAALGIVTGYEDGTFRPYKTISRQEAAAMLDRLYQVLGGKTDVVSEKAFADDAKIGDWARDSVYAMRQTGIMQGKENNQFCPTDGYTAEQSIVTIERMYQIIK